MLDRITAWRTAYLMLVVLCLPVTSGPLAIGDELRSIQPDQKTGSAAAVVVPEDRALLHTTQFLPIDKNGKILHKGNPTRQVEVVLDYALDALHSGGGSLDNIVKINFYGARPDVRDVCLEVLTTYFGILEKPAVSFVVTPLPHPDALVAVDAIAAVGGTRRLMSKSRMPNLPGPKHRAHAAMLLAGGAVYISGQAEPGNLREATRKTLASLDATLTHLGLHRAHVVQVKSFLQPMVEWRTAQEEIDRYFGESQTPPTAYVQWKSSAPIEIEMIVTFPARSSQVGNDTVSQETVTYVTPPGMKASPIYSRVARVQGGDRIYISGLYAPNATDAEAEIREIFGRLDEILKLAGSDFRHLVKATYYVSNNETSGKLNEIRPEFYDPQRPPAASKARVQSVGPQGAGITIDMIAVTKTR